MEYLYLELGVNQRNKEQMINKVEKMMQSFGLNFAHFYSNILQSIRNVYLSSANYTNRQPNDKGIIENFFIRPYVTPTIELIIGKGNGLLFCGDIKLTRSFNCFKVKDIILCENTDKQEYELLLKTSGIQIPNSIGRFSIQPLPSNSIMRLDTIEQVPYIGNQSIMQEFQDNWSEYLDFEHEVIKSRIAFESIESYDFFEVYKVDYNQENLDRFEDSIFYENENTRTLHVQKHQSVNADEETIPLLEIALKYKNDSDKRRIVDFSNRNLEIGDHKYNVDRETGKLKTITNGKNKSYKLGYKHPLDVQLNQEKKEITIYYYLDDSAFNVSGEYKLEDEIKNINKIISSEPILMNTASGDMALYSRGKKALENFYRGEVKNPWLSGYILEPENFADTYDRISYSDFEDNMILPLNPSQKKAVYKALNTNDIFLIQGPPGTGKTQTITEIIYQFNRLGKKVLLSSQSNIAIRNVIERLPNELDILPIRLINEENRSSKYTPDKIVDNLYKKINAKYNQKLIDFKEYREKIEELEQRVDSMISVYTGIKVKRQKIKELKEKADKHRVDHHRLGEELSKVRVSLTMLLKRNKNLRILIDGNFEKEIDINPVELLNHYKKDIRVDEFLTSVSNVTSSSFKTIPEYIRFKRKKCSEKRIKDLEREIERFQDENVEALANITEEIDTLKKARNQFQDDKVMMKSFNDKIKNLVDERKRIQDETESHSSNITIYFNDLKHINVNDIIEEKNTAEDYIKRLLIYETKLIKQIESVIKVNDNEIDKLSNRKTKLDKDISMINNKIAGFVDESVCIEEPIKKKFVKLENFFDEFYEKMNLGHRGETEEAKIDEIKAYVESQKEKFKTKEKEFNYFKDIYKEISKFSDRDKEVVQQDRLRLTKQLLDKNANVYGLTCTASPIVKESRTNYLKELELGDINIYNIDFDVVIIDEVSKANPIELLIPILFGKSVILVGDHRQLPPVFKYRASDIEKLPPEIGEVYSDRLVHFEKLVDDSLFKSIFNKVEDSNKETLLLQYRMHSHIMDVINCFYNGQLELGFPTQNEEKQHYLNIEIDNRTFISENRHTYWLNSHQDYEGNISLEQWHNNSAFNPNEIDITVKTIIVIENGYKKLKQSGREFKKPSVGVITTYGRQAGEINKRLKNEKITLNHIKLAYRNITTVDDFQGEEKDIIIVNLVRNAKRVHKNMGAFVKKFERINVAMSRARKMLIIIGSIEFFTQLNVDIPHMITGKIEKKRIYNDILNSVIESGYVFQNASELLKGVKK